MPTVRELVTTWGFDINDKPIQAMESAVAAAKSTVLQATATITGLTASIFALAKSSVSSAIELRNTSTQVNASAEDLQAFEHAAKLAGFSAGDMDQMLMNLQSAAMQAAYGTGEVKTGLLLMKDGIRDANGEIKKTPGMLIDMLKGINQVKSASQQRFMLQDMFGSLAPKVLEFAKGSESLEHLIETIKRSGHVISDSAINSAAAYNKTMVNLADSVDKARFTIGVEFLPLVSHVIQTLTRWAEQNKELIKSSVISFIHGLGSAFKWLESNITVDRLKTFAQVLEGIAFAKAVMWAAQLAINIASIAAAVAGFLLTPVGLILGIGAAIIGVGLATGKLNVSDIRAWAVNVGKWLLSAKDAVVNFVSHFRQNHPIITGLLESLERAFARTFGAISDLVKDVFGSTAEHVDGFSTRIENSIGAVEKFSSNMDERLDKAQSAGSKFSSWLASFSKDIKSSDLDTFGVGLTNFIDALSNRGDLLISGLGKAFKDLASDIQEALPWLTKAGDYLGDLAHKFVQGQSNVIRYYGEKLDSFSAELNQDTDIRRNYDTRSRNAFSLSTLLSDKPGQILNAITTKDADYPGPLRNAATIMAPPAKQDFHFTFNVQSGADLEPARAREFAAMIKDTLENDNRLTYAQIAPTFDKKA